MNTPAHLLLGAAPLTRQGATGRNRAALFGSALPDLSLYLFAGVALFVLRYPPQIVFDELYFSPLWQTVFAIDNSIPLFVALFGLAVWRGWRWVQVLCLAALLHIACDLPLHHDDGRPHFWPFSGWVFASPVSYWDSAHHAAWVVPITLLIAAAAAYVLWWRFRDLMSRVGVFALLAAEIWVSRQWLLFF